MDIFGVGIVELMVVLLIGIIFLGPSRIVELAGKMGFYWREAQRLLREAADAATVKLDTPTSPQPQDSPETTGPEGSESRKQERDG